MARESDQDETNTTQVIHVDFRTGERHNPTLHDASEPDTSTALGSSKEPITDVYTGAEVCRLLGLSRSRLRNLDKKGIISPSGRNGKRRVYTFNDLIALRTAAKLFEQKVRLEEVARAVKALQERLPRVTRPLAELRITHDGNRLVVRSQDGTFEPSTGQMVLDFEVKQLREDVVERLRPAISAQRRKSAYELYLAAAKLDEDPRTFDEAEKLYNEALRLDPYMAIAYTNLGNIWFRRKDDGKAMEMYDLALQIDASQAEAHYNMGYVLLDRGEYDEAAEHFEAAIERDEGFADAYFNLAMALEQSGKREQAREKWKRYLALEPNGQWADFAREHVRS